MTYFSVRRLIVALVSISLIIVSLWLSGIENTWRRMIDFPIWGVLGIISLLFANLFLVSFRFWRVLAHFGIVLPWKVASRACVAGHVAGLLVISLFGQVMGRQMILQRAGVQPVLNASIAAYERILLACVGGVLGLLGAVFLLGQTEIADLFRDLSVAEVAVAAFGGGLLSFWLGYSKFESALSTQAFSLTNAGRVMLIACLTLVAQMLVLGCFVLGVLAISPNTPFLSALAAAAIIGLAASIPVTVNGWGIRELAAVYVLGKLGVSAADAVAVSVVIGLCSTLVILAAAPFLFGTRSASDSVACHPITKVSTVNFEKAAAWILGMAAAIAVFFQVHLIFPRGEVNVNLADPFAILAFATMALPLGQNSCRFDRILN